MWKYLWYARQSKDWNSENTFSMQKKSIISFAKSKWLKISSEDIYEEWKSAYWKKKNGEEDRWKRKKFISLYDILKEESKKNISDRVYLWAIFFDVSRIARNRHDFYELENLMDDGIEILSTSENLNDSAMGRYCFRMMQSESIFYSDRQSSKMTRYNILNITDNSYKSIGSVPAFWYDVDSSWDLFKHKVNSKIVKDIFDLKIKNNYTNKTIQTLLEERFNKEVDKYNSLKKWKSTKALIPSEKKISEILNNSYSIKYHWVREYNFTVNFKDDILWFSNLLNKNNLIDKKFKIQKWNNTMLLNCPNLKIISEKELEKINKKNKVKTDSKFVYDNFLQCSCWWVISWTKSSKYVNYSCLSSSWRTKIPTCNNNTILNESRISEYIIENIISRLNLNLNNKDLIKLLDFIKKEELLYFYNTIKTLRWAITRYENQIEDLKKEFKNIEEKDEKKMILEKIKNIEDKILDNNNLIDQNNHEIEEMSDFLDDKMKKLIKCAYNFNQITQEDKEWFLGFIWLNLILWEDRINWKKYKNPQDRSKKSKDRYQKIAKVQLHPFFQNIYNQSLKIQHEKSILLCQD